MQVSLVCLVIGTFVAQLTTPGSAGHSSLSKELAEVRNLVNSINGKLEKVGMLEKKVQNVERNLNLLLSGVDELNRKSLLLREIHQDNDGRREMLQRISRAVDEMNRKHSASTGRKHKSELERLDKLSENVQALFQIFGGISRKLDDYQTRVERMSSGCLMNDFRLLMTRKMDSLSSSTEVLTECLECSKGKSLKDTLQPMVRHSLESVARRLQLCTVNDTEKTVQRLLQPRLTNFFESLKNDVSFKLQKFGSQLNDFKKECKIPEADAAPGYLRMGKAAGDMAYVRDPSREKGKSHKSTDADSGVPRETPGRIFRKLWRKMTEPINKIGDKIESLGHRLEVSNQRHHNHTVNRLIEWKVREGAAESCAKQVETLEGTFKEAAGKLDNIESRQVTVQNLCSKILRELERVKIRDSTEEDDGVRIVTSSKTGPGLVNGSSREGHTIASSCAELQRQGILKNGIYTIKPKNSTEEFLAYCDMETEGGGWTVIQRRGDYGELRQNFTQGWEMYKRGFGDFQREFWLGNEKMHLLSTQEEVKLRVELEDFEGNTAWAEYSRFRVDDENQQYRLSVGDYKGNATDSLSLHNGKLFSTEDRDNDEVSSCCNCADTFKGGWWYYRCFEANLNGPYHTVPTENGYFLGIIWERWKGDYSLKASEMKIRPLSFEEPQDP